MDRYRYDAGKAAEGFPNRVPIRIVIAERGLDFALARPRARIVASPPMSPARHDRLSPQAVAVVVVVVVSVVEAVAS